jgi:hypothetical protein
MLRQAVPVLADRHFRAKGNNAFMKRTLSITTRTRNWVVSPLLVASILLGGVLSGCGGGNSQTVISTGFPAGIGSNSLTSQAASGGGNLTLTAQDLPTPIFFPAPTGVSDSRVGTPTSDTGGVLTLVPGTAYQTKAGVQFPKAITMKMVFTQPSGVDSQTLNIYYFDGKVWQPVTPADANFSAASGAVQTTITTFQGTGLYAVLASAPPSNPT